MNNLFAHSDVELLLTPLRAGKMPSFSALVPSQISLLVPEVDEQPPFSGDPNKPDSSSGGRVCLIGRLTVKWNSVGLCKTITCSSVKYGYPEISTSDL